VTSDITSFIPSWITPASGYTTNASTDSDRPVIRLFWNESPFPLTPRAQAVVESFTGANRYPDLHQDRLREALGAYVGVDASRVIAGAGLDNVFDSVATLFVEPGDEVIISDPTFGVYRSLFTMRGATVTNIPLGQAPGFELDAEGIVAAVSDRTKLVILCNPNNPTGNVIPQDRIEHVIANVSCPVIIDEAYAEFSDVNHVDLTDRHDHVIVLRTLSKFAGLAGMRVGYGVFPEVLAPFARRVMPSFCNISLLASEVAIASLEDLDILNAQRDQLVAERQRVFDAIDAMDGMTPYTSNTNFILFETPLRDSTPILDGLAERGVVIRRLNNEGLEGCLRVSIGSPEENDAFLTALAAVTERMQQAEVV
jgi:histidinol-phosphate aminotransferase